MSDSGAAPDEKTSGSPANRRRLTVEVLGVFAFATVAAAAIYRVRALDGYFHAIVATLFLYVPAYLLRRADLADYGLRSSPLAKNLFFLAAMVAAVFPPFALGFVLFHKLACAVPALAGLSPIPCAAYIRPSLRLPSGVLSLALAEVLVVALPEEFFFRGYVQGRLAEVFAPSLSTYDRLPRRWMGVRAPLAVVCASALFALCHLVVQGNPATLAVFFPGLVFGWMRDRSGSILPGTLFHALCNLYIETLHRSFYG